VQGQKHAEATAIDLKEMLYVKDNPGVARRNKLARYCPEPLQRRSEQQSALKAKHSYSRDPGLRDIEHDNSTTRNQPTVRLNPPAARAMCVARRSTTTSWAQ
jgi:hypothetical protein